MNRSSTLLRTCFRRCDGKGLSGPQEVNEARAPSGYCIIRRIKTLFRLCFIQFVQGDHYVTILNQAFFNCVKEKLEIFFIQFTEEATTI